MPVPPIFTPCSLVASVIKTSNVPIAITNGLLTGGAIIQNPYDPVDQGLAIAETLQIDMVDGTGRFQDSVTLLPGGICIIPENFEGVVWAKAQSAGHRFSGIALFPYVPFQPFDTPWPPTTFVTMQGVLQSYLYQEYNDDEDLQVFVNVYNSMAQQYITWFASIMLPVFAQNPAISGMLLDWVALGLYGMARPTLSSGQRTEIGPFNSAMFNEQMFNEDIFEGPDNVFVTDDDTFKRILIWHLEKGDGKLFNIRWLKRRIMRFLTGSDGNLGVSAAGDPSTADMYPPDQTYVISITWGAEDEVNINIQSTHRSITDGAMFNAGMFNEFEFNELGTSVSYSESSPWAPIFKAAVASGALELPFQYTWVVNIN